MKVLHSGSLDIKTGGPALSTYLSTKGLMDYGIDVEIHYIKAGASYNDDGTLVQSSAYYNIEVVRDPSIDASITAMQGSISNLTTQINALSDFKDDTESELLTTQMALVEQYESSLVMEETLETTQDELTAAQIALTEQYEANIELEAELADTKAELFRSMEEMILPHKNVEATIYSTQ